MESFKYKAIEDKFDKTLILSIEEAEICLAELKIAVKKTYDEQSEYEKELFISELNKDINFTQTSEHKTWCARGTTNEKNFQDFMLDWESVVESLTNYHKSSHRELNNIPLIDYSIDLNESKQNIRIVYLKELGVLDFLKKEYNGITNNKLATLISSFTGIDAKTVQSYVNPMYDEDNNQKNNPCTTVNTQKVRNKLQDLGINLKK